MPLITLKTFENPVEAHLLKSQLESEGINCFLFDEHTMGLIPFYNVTLGGIKLKIDQKDAKVALEIVDQNEMTDLLNEQNEPLVCPSCGSNKLYQNFRSFKGLSGFLYAAAALLLTIIPFYWKTVYRCKVCETEFK